MSGSGEETEEKEVDSERASSAREVRTGRGLREQQGEQPQVFTGPGRTSGRGEPSCCVPCCFRKETVLVKMLSRAGSSLPYRVLMAIPMRTHRAPKHKRPDACTLLCDLRAQGEAYADRMHPGMHAHACVHIGEFE